MDSSLRRRRFITATVVGATGLLTGCTGGGGNGDGDGGNGAGDGTGDGGNGDGREEGELDGTGDGGGDGGDGDGGGGGSNPALSESFGMTEEFAFDVESETEGQQMTMSGRFSGGNMYIQFESEDGEGEFYIVGDDQYIISSSQGETQCIQTTSAPFDENRVNPGEYESTVSEYPDITASGTTAIDGEQVYIYELTSDVTGRSETVTYYVGVNSGYLRRVESPEAVVNFHSWNDVGAIEAPDMECRDMSQGGPGGMPPGGSGEMPSGPGSGMPSQP